MNDCRIHLCRHAYNDRCLPAEQGNRSEKRSKVVACNVGLTHLIRRRFRPREWSLSGPKR